MTEDHSSQSSLCANVNVTASGESSSTTRGIPKSCLRSKICSDEGKALNFICRSTPGCYVVRHHWSRVSVEYSPLDVADFGLEESDLDGPEKGSLLPELSIDPDLNLLTLINVEKDSCKSYTVSFTDECLPVRDLNGEILKAGKHSFDGNTWKDCVTFIVLVKPRHCLDLCYLPSTSVKSGICSDVQLIKMEDVKASFGAITPTAVMQEAADALQVYGFPLDESRGPFLCSQGFGGGFTHFFSATRFAVDFECEEGTPVVAVADAVVVACSDRKREQGILASNLFCWNSITLDLLNGSFAEYVHIYPGSIVVKVGEQVSKGQVLCQSGNVGFSPTPHLHLQITESIAKDAQTIPFMLQAGSNKSKPYIPIAGEFYP